MGKRSDFKRLARDAYNTPAAAVAPLLPHLKSNTRFVEPCCGDGYLVGHLKRAGHVLVSAFDLPHDARVKRYDVSSADNFITNTPWHREILHPIIVNLSNQLPTWLLIDADWMHTKQSIPFKPRLRIIASIGRVRWFEGSAHSGKDSCCWCLFDRPDPLAITQFIGRIDLTPADSTRRVARMLGDLKSG